MGIKLIDELKRMKKKGQQVIGIDYLKHLKDSQIEIEPQIKED